MGTLPYQWGPGVVSYLRSRSCGVHVAEKLLDLAERDATAPVAHLQTEGNTREEELVPAQSGSIVHIESFS